MDNYNRLIRSSLVLSANANSGVLDNTDHATAIFYINISQVTGTAPTLTVTVEGIDPVSGAAGTLITSTALNSAGLTVLRIGKGFLASANLVVNDILPKLFRLQYVLGGSASPTVTFSVGAAFNL